MTKNGEWPDKAACRPARTSPDRRSSAERLRILYVALTRARHHTVVWWARNNYSVSNALTRLLFARDADGVVVPDLLDPPTREADRFKVPGDR